MPLGASIVFGQDSTDGNGFRGHLRDYLQKDGWDVQMVGSNGNGSMLNWVCLSAFFFFRGGGRTI